MYLRLLAFALSVSISACGGSGTTRLDAAAPPVAVEPTGLRLLETNFNGTANGISLDGNGTLSSGTNYSIRFVDETYAILTVGSRNVLLTFDGFNRYDDDDGLASLFFSKGPVDGVIDADVVALTYVERPDAATAQTLYNYVTGIATDPAAVTGFGRAEYSGNGHFWNSDGDVSVSTVGLDVDFANGTVDGQFSQAIPRVPSAVLTMTGGEITGTTFAGTLDSTDTVVGASAVTGGFYGDNAGSAAGVASADTGFGAISGYFIANR